MKLKQMTPTNTLQTSSGPLVRNSFLLTVRPANPNNTDTVGMLDPEGVMKLQLSTMKTSGKIHIAENEKFILLLDGYFYFNDSREVDARENLSVFLGMLNILPLSDVANKISGGLFNLIVFERDTQVLRIFNDRLGLLPLFILPGLDSFLVTNNQFNLMDQSHLSSDAVFEFMKFGYLPVSDALFENVLRPDAGSVFEIQTATSTYSSKTNSEIMVGRQSVSVGINELVDKWAKRFTRVFSKVIHKKIMLGLSGGNDSRLITAFLREQNPQLLNFGDQKNTESQLAGKVASKLGLPFQNEQFPNNSIAQYAEHLQAESKVITSLENIHVMHLSRRVKDFAPGIYIDGFLGDVILGDTYYAKRDRNIKGLFSFLFASNDCKSKLESDSHYANALYKHDKEGLSDDLVKRYVDCEFQSRHLLNKFKNLVSKWRSDTDSHEDLIERLRLLTRGRHLIAGGPVTIQTHTQVFLPFMDYQILDLSAQTAKSLRQGHFLYNKLWNRYFPTMARIRTAGSFGKASDFALIFRIKALLFILKKTLENSWVIRKLRSKRQAEEQYFSLENYLSDPETKVVIEEVMLEKHPLIPWELHSKIADDYANHSINKFILIRYLTLSLYLKGVTKE